MVLSALLSGPAFGEVILVVGDSLSAAYNIPRQSGWVNLLQQRLAAGSGDRFRVVNASISGDTTAGGVARLPALLDQYRPDILVLELGANDGLRGLPLAILRRNLQTMIDAGTAGGAKVVLVNVQLPPSYGKFFNEKFQAVFSDLQQRNGLPMVIFGFAQLNDIELIQEDGLHPTEAAQPMIVDLVLPVLAKLLADQRGTGLAADPEKTNSAKSKAVGTEPDSALSADAETHTETDADNESAGR